MDGIYIGKELLLCRTKIFSLLPLSSQKDSFAFFRYGLQMLYMLGGKKVQFSCISIALSISFKRCHYNGSGMHINLLSQAVMQFFAVYNFVTLNTYKQYGNVAKFLLWVINTVYCGVESSLCLLHWH